MPTSPSGLSNLPFWDNQGLPIAIAHRGGDLLGVQKENSLAAIEAAVKLGYKWFETDVVPTSDGKLLAIHGRGFQLHPNRDLPYRRVIRSLTYSQVQRKLRIGGEPVPLLEEILQTFPQTKWFIDPKVTKAIEPLIKILKNSRLDLDRISVGAFSQRRTDAVADAIEQAYGRRICTVLGPVGCYALLNLTNINARDLEPRDAVLLRLFKLTGQLRDARAIIKRHQAVSVSVPYRWVRHSNFVEVAHRHGLYVVSWTPNTRENIAASLAAGVDGIMSDNVKALKDIILASDSTNPSLSSSAVS